MYEWLRVEDTLVTLRLRREQDWNETDGWCFFDGGSYGIDGSIDREEVVRCLYDARCWQLLEEKKEVEKSVIVSAKSTFN